MEKEKSIAVTRQVKILKGVSIQKIIHRDAGITGRLGATMQIGDAVVLDRAGAMRLGQWFRNVKLGVAERRIQGTQLTRVWKLGKDRSTDFAFTGPQRSYSIVLDGKQFTIDRGMAVTETVGFGRRPLGYVSQVVSQMDIGDVVVCESQREANVYAYTIRKLGFKAVTRVQKDRTYYVLKQSKDWQPEMSDSGYQS